MLAIKTHDLKRSKKTNNKRVDNLIIMLIELIKKIHCSPPKIVQLSINFPVN